MAVTAVRPAVPEWCAILLLTFSVQASSADAQPPAPRPAQSAASMMARWPVAARAEITALFDSAMAIGVPVAPLRAKIAEGLAKDAAPETIRNVVKMLYGNLRTARQALGVRAAESELVAAAAAVHSGATPEQVRVVRASIPVTRTSTQAFVVLTDLAHRGVAPDEAVAELTRLTRAGAGDATLDQLRLDVARDVVSGIAARASLARRASEYVSRGLAPPEAIFPPSPPDDSSLTFSVGVRGWPTVNGPVQGVTAGMHVGTTWSWARARIEATAASVRRPGSGSAAPGLLEANLLLASTPLRIGRVAADASIGIERDASDLRSEWMQKGASLRAWYGAASHGLWGRAGVFAPRDAHVTPGSTQVQAGAWLARGATDVRVFARRIETSRMDGAGPDSAGKTPTNCLVDFDPRRALQQYRSLCRERLRTLDVGVDAAWSIGIARVGLFAAHRLLAQAESGVPRESWLGGNVEFGWSDALRFTVQAERRPTDVVRGVPGHRRFAVGVRVFPPALQKRRLGETRLDARPVSRVAPLRLGMAATAEVRGDFTDWQTVRLTRDRDDVWNLPPGIPPGVYTLSVRLDGGPWHAPPGLPTTTDGFGDVVGVLVVD